MNHAKYWIALEQTQGIGPAHLKEIHAALQKQSVSIADIFDLTALEIKNEFSFPEKLCSAITSSRELLTKADEDYIQCLEADVAVIPFFSPSYPPRLLKTMGNASPPFLYILCNREILTKRGVALLGDKNVSEKGELIAFSAAKELALHHIAIISGFAKGADMIAHRSALEHRGFTMAVVPFGIMHYKTPGLLSEVFDPERVLIVSPFYPTREINTFNAFIRNRVICALSCAVYIIEAPEEGGIFEAAKSAHNLAIPLFTTEYTEYPENAAGNKKIIEEFGGQPVRGKVINEMLVPNMDRIIAIAKFGD